jgi:hypothetical protein
VQLKQVSDLQQRQLAEIREQNHTELLAKADLQHQYDLLLQQTKVRLLSVGVNLSAPIPIPDSKTCIDAY